MHNPFTGVDRYTCPDCGFETLRSELRRSLSFEVLAGGPTATLPDIATPLGTTTVYDVTQATSSITSGTFTVAAGDTIVACVGQHLGGIVDSATIGGVPMTLISQGGTFAYIFAKTGFTPGTASITVNWTPTLPLSLVLSVSRISVPVTAGVGAGDNGSGTLADSTPTTTLPKSTGVAIAALEVHAASIGIGWQGGFTESQRDGTNGGLFDSVLSEAHLPLSSIQPAQALATLSVSRVWGCTVAVFQ
jgi:hypothetical protein